MALREHDSWRSFSFVVIQGRTKECASSFSSALAPAHFYIYFCCLCLPTTLCNHKTSLKVPAWRACIWTPQGLAHGSVGQQSKGITMRHCINCCLQLSPDDTHEQRVGCRGGPHHSRHECPVCKGENKIVFRVDGKQMNLLAVLEVRADGNESWGGFFRFKKGKRCSLVFGLIIMTLVMASYILSGAHQELLTSSPFHYGAFPSNPSLMDSENPSDTKEQHHQPSVNNISYMKDYPSIKLIINSITARIEFTTRQLPAIEDLKKQELHVSSLVLISVD